VGAGVGRNDGEARLATELARHGLSSELISFASDPDPVATIANTDVHAVPLAVVFCRTIEDVRAVILVATVLSLTLAVRGGGFSPGGLGTVAGGVVVDLSGFDTIRVDPVAGTVTIGGGVTAGALEEALAPHQLAMTLPVPSAAGVVGSALSGGIGLLVRKLGLVCDAIIGAQLVTGTGEIVRIEPGDEHELLWGLRGGGGNFGVVTALVFRCHPLTEVTMARAVFPIANLGDGLRFYREWNSRLTNDLTTVAMARSAPPFPGLAAEHIGRPCLLVTATHAGASATADAELRPLLEHPLAAFVSSSRAPLAQIRRMMDAGSPDVRFGAIVRSGWTSQITDADIADIAELAESLPTRDSLIEVAAMRGAVGRVGDGSCAPGRDAEYLLNVMSLWPDPADADSCRDWAERGKATLDRIRDGDALVPGFVAADELDHASSTYGEAFERLRSLKDVYDPNNLLSRNLNIQPHRLQHA
jgi:FAD/FMN-containing dehydrogenase